MNENTFLDQQKPKTIIEDSSQKKGSDSIVPPKIDRQLSLESLLLNSIMNPEHLETSPEECTSSFLPTKQTSSPQYPSNSLLPTTPAMFDFTQNPSSMEDLEKQYDYLDEYLETTPTNFTLPGCEDSPDMNSPTPVKPKRYQEEQSDDKTSRLQEIGKRVSDLSYLLSRLNRPKRRHRAIIDEDWPEENWFRKVELPLLRSEGNVPSGKEFCMEKFNDEEFCSIIPPGK